ncbi:hypothetical protein ACFSTC_06285 [Nonomuraea ferruginea]
MGGPSRQRPGTAARPAGAAGRAGRRVRRRGRGGAAGGPAQRPARALPRTASAHRPRRPGLAPAPG